MATISRLLLLLIPYIGFASSTTERQKSVVSYTVSLIRHLASKQPGTFDCWLYHACSDPPGTSQLLQQIVVQLEMQWIPRRTIDSRFPWTEDAAAWKPPSLVVILVEFRSYKPDVMDHIGTLFGLLDRQTKILVLLNTRLVSPLTFESPITTGKLYNMAFLSVDQELLVFPDIRAEQLTRFRKFWAPEAMFPDQSRYLHGTPLRYSVFEGLLDTCVGNRCEGYHVAIVQEIARYLNTTAYYERFVCPYKIDKRKESASKCVYTTMMEPDCPFDIFATPSAAGTYLQYYLEEPIPYDYVLLAPRGRSLNIAELFLRPFQTELWVLFFIGMVSVKLISQLVPNTFKNDPLLLPICGFERYNLNQAGRNEKLFMISLIILFFFVSNAYETKIISLMSNKPHVMSVTTIQDVLDSGTPVKVGYLTGQAFPLFESLYVFYDQAPSRLDGTSVYLINGVIGALMVQRKINWDYESNQPQYKVMREILNMNVGFYPLPRRSALKPHFRFVLKALFESGIIGRWYEEWYARGDLKYSDPTMAGGVNPSSDILKFSDLLPAWFVVLCGTVLSTIAVTAELLSYRPHRTLVLKLCRKLLPCKRFAFGYSVIGKVFGKLLNVVPSNVKK